MPNGYVPPGGEHAPRHAGDGSLGAGLSGGGRADWSWRRATNTRVRVGCTPPPVPPPLPSGSSRPAGAPAGAPLSPGRRGRWGRRRRGQRRGRWQQHRRRLPPQPGGPPRRRQPWCPRRRAPVPPLPPSRCTAWAVGGASAPAARGATRALAGAPQQGLTDLVGGCGGAEGATVGDNGLPLLPPLEAAAAAAAAAGMGANGLSSQPCGEVPDPPPGMDRGCHHPWQRQRWQPVGDGVGRRRARAAAGRLFRRRRRGQRRQRHRQRGRRPSPRAPPTRTSPPSAPPSCGRLLPPTGDTTATGTSAASGGSVALTLCSQIPGVSAAAVAATVASAAERKARAAVRSESSRGTCGQGPTSRRRRWLFGRQRRMWRRSGVAASVLAFVRQPGDEAVGGAAAAGGGGGNGARTGGGDVWGWWGGGGGGEWKREACALPVLDQLAGGGGDRGTAGSAGVLLGVEGDGGGESGECAGLEGLVGLF